MKPSLPTVAHYLDAGLQLPPLPKAAQKPPASTCCVMTGVPAESGYLVSDVTTSATNEFLDTFCGQPDGWLCEAAARAFKIHNLGNVVVLEDGTTHRPMIARESAAEQERACWSDLFRALAKHHRGQSALLLLTTDFKKRLWPRARVGVIGAAMPVFVHDGKSSQGSAVNCDCDQLVQVLDVIESVYAEGYAKQVIGASLYKDHKQLIKQGHATVALMEQKLAPLRALDEFPIALLVAQKPLETNL